VLVCKKWEFSCPAVPCPALELNLSSMHEAWDSSAMAATYVRIECFDENSRPTLHVALKAAQIARQPRVAETINLARSA
jgi:hypothetical protein